MQSSRCSGGSRISPRWGCQPSGGHQHKILPNFPKNCMKFKEFGPREGANVPHAPLDPPLHWSNLHVLGTGPVSWHFGSRSFHSDCRSEVPVYSVMHSWREEHMNNSTIPCHLHKPVSRWFKCSNTGWIQTVFLTTVHSCFVTDYIICYPSQY